MATAKFSDDYKRDAVHQIVERGNPVAEVSKRLGVSSHSLYAWKKRFAKSHFRDGSLGEQAAEIRRLKLEPAMPTAITMISSRSIGASPSCPHSAHA